MIKTQTTEFDNEMKALSQGVYMGNEKSIPKDWIKVSEYNKRSGFHGEAFYKNGIDDPLLCTAAAVKHFTKMEKL